MTGLIKVTLNHEEMANAVEYYMNRAVLREPARVVKVESNRESYGGSTFVVELDEADADTLAKLGTKNLAAAEGVVR